MDGVHDVSADAEVHQLAQTVKLSIKLPHFLQLLSTPLPPPSTPSGSIADLFLARGSPKNMAAMYQMML